MERSKQRTAVITGANAGLGLALVDRLLTEHADLQVCLACRNQGRADVAKKRLLRRHPGANIEIVIVNTSSVKSVLKAADEIKERFPHLCMLYLNAGIMKVTSVNWSQVLAIFSSRGPQILNTGEGVLNQGDGVTDEGLQEVFATNLFGHFVMVRELQDHYGNDTPLKIVWSSSKSANPDLLNFDDIQHRNGPEPYASSKYATDVISIALNDRLNKQGIYSVTISPGLVMSNMTFGILPSWFWLLVLPFICLMRLFVSSLSYSPHNGAEALVWASKQQNERFDPRIKYLSQCSLFGKTYVGEEKLHIADKDADNLYGQLEDLYQGFKHRYRKSDIHETTNGHHVTS